MTALLAANANHTVVDGVRPRARRRRCPRADPPDVGGARGRAAQNGETLLHRAAYYNWEGTVKALLEAGADTNAKGKVCPRPSRRLLIGERRAEARPRALREGGGRGHWPHAGTARDRAAGLQARRATRRGGGRRPGRRPGRGAASEARLTSGGRAAAPRRTERRRCTARRTTTARGW